MTFPAPTPATPTPAARGSVAPAPARPRRARALLTALACLAVAVAVSACAPPPPPERVVVVYGDSMLVESYDEVLRQLADLPGTRVVVRAYGGTAQCDWHHRMVDDATTAPDAVVVAFSGNRFTPCATSRPWVPGYTDDATWAAAFWASRSVPLAFVGTPPPVGTAHGPVFDAYASVSASAGVPMWDSAPLFAGPDGISAERATCLADEGEDRGCGPDGTVVVHAADGVHLCATYEPGRGCIGYQSGPRRYASVLSSAARHLLGVGPAPAPTTTTSSTSTTSSTTTTTTTTTPLPSV